MAVNSRSSSTFLLLVLGAAVAGGCKKLEAPELQYSTVRDIIELGTVSYSDSAVPTQAYSIVNTGGLTLLVSVLGVEGDGAQYVTVTGLGDYTELDPEEHATVGVSLDNDALLWDDGDYEVVIQFEVGAFWNDPRDWNRDPQWTSKTVDVPVHFRIICDYDGDGSEDAACGGEDCNDLSVDVVSASEEVCDGVDNDCDGAIDEDASDAATWYLDYDGDGYGTPDSTTEACEQPDDYVTDDTDCDDRHVAVYPSAPETADAMDDDCDGLVDEDSVSVGDAVLTEVMIDPTGSDAGLQWFEVYNASSRVLYMQGWQIDLDGTVVAVSTDARVSVTSGGHVLFCQDAAMLEASAPSVSCDYEYGTGDNGYGDSDYGPASSTEMVFGLDGGSLSMDLDGEVIDSLAWAPSWLLAEGAAMSLDRNARSADENDQVANWCEASTTFDAAGENAGTPGTLNPSCP